MLLSTVLLRKIIAVKGLKRVGQAAAAERGSLVTMALAVNAAGNSVPPFFIFPRKRIHRYLMGNAPPTADAACNESGWMQQTEFVKYMRHFIKYSGSNRENPTLLLLDNHISHLSIEAIDLAREHGITMLTFPPHCSHRMQPLDVSIYGPVKGYYSKQCKDWQLSNAGKALDIRHIPGLACAALDQALNPANIKSGFAKTGIYPFNRSVFTEADFVQANLTNQAAEIERNLRDNPRRILDFDAEVTASIPKEPSTSSTDMSLSSILSHIGPLTPAPPQTKSNRGRKPMKSTVLTSSENIEKLKEKRQKAYENKKNQGKKTQKRKHSPVIEPAESIKKRTQPARAVAAKNSSFFDFDDIDFCMICMQYLPDKLTINNSIECNMCKRPFHLKCAKMTASYFTCRNCDSD